MCTFPEPFLPPQLITNLNQGLPSFPAHLLVLSSPCSVVGFVFVLGCFPSYGPGKAEYWLLLLHGQLREMNLKPDLSSYSQPCLVSFITRQQVTPGTGPPQEPDAQLTPLPLGLVMSVNTFLSDSFRH